MKKNYTTLMTFCLITIFLLNLSLVSAFEFDNVKSYDPITREVTIKNFFGLGAEIGKARLNTPLNVKVPQGYQKVAEFDLWAYQDYNDALKQFTFIDMKKKEKINRDYDLKYLTYENIEVDDYDNVVIKIYKNGTKETEYRKVGSHKEKIEVWNKVTPANLKKNEKLTIGVFTDVNIGDYIDWVPIIYGVKIPEWATWTEDLNVDIISYYKFDETSGAVVDSLGLYNGTATTPTRGATGILNKSFDFDGAGDYVTTGEDPAFDFVTGSTFSFSFWIQPDSWVNGDRLLSTDDGTNGYQCIATTGNKVQCWGNGGGVVNSDDTITVDGTTWNHIVWTWNAGTTIIYINGDVSTPTSGATTTIQSTEDLEFGRTSDTGGTTYDGVMDEVGIWNRVLSTAEVTQLYNGGLGITYIGDFDANPTITLNSPSSTNYTTSPQNIQINFTAWDDINLTNVKLYINDILNQTNASGINNTDYIFDLVLRDGNYTIYGKATDNDSQETNSSSIQININTIPNIHFISPTYANGTNLSTSSIPINISLTEIYFANVTFYFYKGGVLNESITFTNSTRFYNKTVCTCDTWKINATTWTTTGQSNSTETRIYLIDLLAPNISIANNLTDLTPYALPTNSTWNYTVIDSHTDKCYYNTSENTTQTIVTCNASITTTWTMEGNKTIQYCANDTFGNEACNTKNIFINYVQETATYDITVIEQETATLILNITATNINSFNGTLHYNGTDYTPTISNHSTEGILTTTIITPFVSSNTLVYFNWTYTLNGVDYNSSNYNQTIMHLTDLIISASCDDKALRFDLQDEGNLSAIYGNIDYNFQYGISNNSLKTAYGSLNNITTFYICINASVSENYTIGYGEIQYSNGIYIPRRFYLFEGKIISNNTLTNHTLRDLLSTDQTSFLLTFEDTSLNVYDNKYTALWRWYPDLNEYQIVEMGKTDEDGQTVSHVDTEDVDYRVGLYHLNGSLIKLGDPLRFLCTSAPCSFTLRVGAGEIDYSSIFDVQTALTYNQTSGMFLFIYNDPNQDTSTMRLLVTRETGSSTLTICDDTSSGFTGVMSCNTSAYTGVKKAVVYRSASPPIIIAQKLVSDLNTTFNSGFGLFVSLFLWLAIVLSGFGNNPIWTIILGIVGLIPALIIGSINLTIFTGIAILGAIIIHFIKRAVAN